MNSAFFHRQWTAIQKQLRQNQSGNWLKRILVWLMLGVLMIFSLAALLFLLLLSWILLPWMMIRTRRMMQQPKPFKGNSDNRRHQHDNVIEGEVVDREQQ
ncbi:MAG TPA: hypothetical protein VFM76_09580 [Methylophaga sp.]|nr:hypothetical protein [Methylophaga sp.]